MSMFPCLNLSLAKTTTACLPREEQEKRSGYCFYALHVSAEFVQFFIEMLVTTVNVIDSTHFGNSVCFQARKHQRGGRAQVARHHWRAEETIHSINHRSGTLQFHLRAHAF